MISICCENKIKKWNVRLEECIFTCSHVVEAFGMMSDAHFVFNNLKVVLRWIYEEDVDQWKFGKLKIKLPKGERERGAIFAVNVPEDNAT